MVHEVPSAKGRYTSGLTTAERNESPGCQGVSGEWAYYSMNLEKKRGEPGKQLSRRIFETFYVPSKQIGLESFSHLLV